MGTPTVTPGAAEHYADPAYYTKTYAGRVEDVAYYVALAGALGADRVLEYGAGNGRIALPLARHGIAVTAVDASAPMLADLRARLAAEDPAVARRITVRPGDLRTYRGRARYPLILCTFNTVLHLYTRAELAAFLGHARAQLAPGGRLVIDLSTPSLDDLTADPDRERRMPRFRHPRLGVVSYGERFSYDFVRQVLTVTMRTTPLSGAPEEIVTLSQRQYFPQEFEGYLESAGLNILHCDGGFSGEAPSDTSEVLIFHAARRGR